MQPLQQFAHVCCKFSQGFGFCKISLQDHPDPPTHTHTHTNTGRE